MMVDFFLLFTSCSTNDLRPNSLSGTKIRGKNILKKISHHNMMTRSNEKVKQTINEESDCMRAVKLL